MSEDVVDNAATASDFTVSGIASEPTVDSIVVSGSTITLNLTGGEITGNDAVITVTYTQGSGSIDDLAGNSLSGFADIPVTNTFDIIPPTLVSVNISSNNADTSFAKA